MIASGFKYDRETSKVLDELEKMAKFEGYYEDSKDEFEALKQKLSHNIGRDLDTNKEEIKHLLQSNIVPAYYFQKGMIANQIQYDVQIKEAARLVVSGDEYRKILTKAEEK